MGTIESPHPFLSRRQALLALLSLPLADVRALQPARHGHLTVPLDQWGTIGFEFRGKRVEFTVAQVFAILQERV